ncbi:MAG: hypothetical protein OXI74_06225 [Rhodospirillaceae bacterium]|nr:hypothetical protein [Rhodospirillaceae bacterium]
MRIPAATPTETLRRTLKGVVLPLLATILLLALPSAVGAQVQRILVIALSEAPLTADEDTTTPGTTTYTVRLSTQPSSDVTVTVESGDEKIATVDTDTNTGDDQDTLTFTTANWHTAQAVTVTAVNDNVDNVGDERSVTVTNTPSGGGFTAAETVDVTVYDDDDAALTITPTSITDLFESGANQQKTYTVSLATEPTGNVIVNVASEDTGAATVNPSSLTFTPKNYETGQTVTVTGVDDKVVNDPARSVTIVHTPSGGGYGPDETGRLAVTVTNGHGGNPVPTPTKGLTFSPAEPIVVEGQQVTYTVKLDTKPTGTVRLELSRSSGEHLTFSPQHLIFTTDNWYKPQTVTVTGFEDDVDDGPDGALFADINDNRKTTITHLPSGGGYDGLTGSPDPKQLIIGLRDNDTAGLILSRPSLRLIDEGVTGTYTVKLSSEPTNSVTVDLAVTGDTSAASVAPNQLTFTATTWNTVQTVTVTADDDDFDDPGVSRMAPITHTPTSGGEDYGAASQVKSLQLTVVDNDFAGVTLSLSRLTIREDAMGTYTVVLNSDPEASVSVTVTSDNAAARATTPAEFTSANWFQPQTITVSGINDNVDNVGGSRVANLTHVFSGNYAPDQTVQVTVTDADPRSQVQLSPTSLTVYESGRTATYRVRLREAPSSDQIVTVTVPSGITVVDNDGSRVTSLDFTTANEWQTLTVSTDDDDEDNGNRSVVVTHTHTITGTLEDDIGADIRVRIIDDDAAEVIVDRVGDTDTITEIDGTITYNVKLGSAPPSDSVTVYVVSSDPGVANVTAGSSLNFNDGTWGTAQPVTVSAVRDDVDNGARRSVNIMFTPTGGGYGPAEAENKRVTVIDDDTAGLNASPDELEISESGGGQSYSLSLATRPTGTVRVTVTSSDVAVAKIDTDPDTPGEQNTLTFRSNSKNDNACSDTANRYAWNCPQTVLVTGVSDATRGDRTATITHTPAEGGYGSGQSARITVRVTEDTSPGLRAPAQVTVVEGGTESFTVELNSQPTENVTVTVTNRSTSVISTVAPGSLTFSPTNWNTPQQVTVTASNDMAVTGDRRGTIRLASTGVNADYDFEKDVEVTVTDDDATVTVSRSSVEVAEAGGTATYTFQLDGEPTETVTVTVKSSNLNIATVSPRSLSFTPSDWNKAQTVTITSVNDSTPGGNRSATITHEASGGGYDETEIPEVSVTVTDDDGMTVAPTAVEVAEAGDTATYRVSLNTQPTGTVTVAVASSSTSIATVSPGSLTFTPSNWTAKTVTVTGVNDQVDNGDSRSATITNTPSGAGYSSDHSISVDVTVTDDEDAPTLAISGGEVAEGNTGTTPLTFTVTKSGDTNQVVTVDYADDDRGTATAGTDYTVAAAGTLTFAPNETSKTITVMVRGDDEPEPDETVVIALSSPSNATFPRNQTTVMATGTIVDDDLKLLPIKDVTVPEGDQADILLRLERPLQKDVLIGYSIDGTATEEDYSLSLPGGLPLPPQTIPVPAGAQQGVVTVAALEDSLAEGNERIIVTLTTVGSASARLGQVTVTIEDNDELSVSVTGPKTVTEGDEARFTVRVGGAESTAPVNVSYSLGGGTAKASDDYTAPNSTMVSVPAGQQTATISIQTKPDNVLEPDETLVVTLTGATTAGSAAVGSPKSATTAIQDPVYHSFNRVNQTLLPGVVRASTASALEAIGWRMAEGAGGDPVATADLAGLTGLYRELQANEYTLQDGSYDLAKVLGGSSFLVPLGSHDGDSEGGVGFAVWGGGDFRMIGGGAEDVVKWDGSVWSARVGADVRFVDSLLTGMVVSYASGALDYTDATPRDDREGTYGTWLASVHPYVGWTSPDFGVWASGGFGGGGLTLDDSGADAQETDITQWSVGGGGSVTLLSGDWLVAGGTTALKLKADGFLAGAIVPASENKLLQELTVGVNQVRGAVEASHAQHFAGGGALKPTLEIGGRYDGGDGEAGAGLEVGGGLTYSDAGLGLTVAATGRTLVLRENYGEWGLSGLLQWDPDAGGHGLMMSVRPTIGVTASGVSELWEHGTLELLSDGQPGGRVEAEIGYGLPAFGGVLTPYSAVEFSVTGQQSYRAGTHFELGQGIALSAEGTHQQSASGVVDQFLTLEMRLRQ